jgi:DNA-binding transcriptional MerR regulator
MDKDSSGTILRSGEFARLAGVSTDTLRHYERKNLLKPRRSRNGYREYTLPMLDRVRLIRRAIAVGFSIEELRSILKARDRGEAPCRQVHKLAMMKLADVESQLVELEQVRDDLRTIVDDWQAKLAEVSDDQPAHLLESLVNRRNDSRTTQNSLNHPSLTTKFKGRKIS